MFTILVIIAIGPAPGQSTCYCSEGLSLNNKARGMMLCYFVKNYIEIPAYSTAYVMSGLDLYRSQVRGVSHTFHDVQGERPGAFKKSFKSDIIM